MKSLLDTIKDALKKKDKKNELLVNTRADDSIIGKELTRRIGSDAGNFL